MKKIAIALFTIVALASCGGGAEKCEDKNCADTCTVAPVTTDSVAPVADSAKVDTAAVK